MDRKIRVAAVSYLNTKPLTYGFEHGELDDLMELQFAYPANLASLLVNNEVDVGLLPVAMIPKLNEYHIISDYCIGADGEVASVCLFSDVPLNQITTIYLDYQSRTSVALLKILLKHHWKIQPEILSSNPGYESSIHGTAAGLVIGDRALMQRNSSRYIYDLSTAWKEMTGLPFVFAAWVANKKLPESFIAAFNSSNAKGLEKIDELVVKNEFKAYSLHKYYTENIQYRLDDKKRAALKLFLELLIEV